MVTFQFDDETAARLQELAKAAGAANVEDYIKLVIATPRPTTDKFDPKEFDRELEPLLFDGPSLPADFSREDIYFDHD
ncbi:MAG: hypothetical protein JNL96_18965 [Planctomycetaceae bacterium]|nr:hypothetical protein [Planctomycetaceae bacterium]